VRVHRKVDINALARDRAQLWAEAFAAYAAGEAWWIEDAEVEKMAAAAQAERAEVDPMAAAVERFLAEHCMSEATDAEPHAFSTKEIILDALHLETRDVNTSNNRRVATIMRKLGWEQGGQERGGTRRGERLWRPGETWMKRQEEAKAADAEKAKQAAARAAERAAQWTASREQKAAPTARGASYKPDERTSVTRDDPDPPDDGGVGFDVFDDFDVDDPLV
jgi:predicted P-loop ATPase